MLSNMLPIVIMDTCRQSTQLIRQQCCQSGMILYHISVQYRLMQALVCQYSEAVLFRDRFSLEWLSG